MAEQRTNLSPRRTRRSRADIVEAALGILEEQGLPDLTMRRLGEVLDLQASALYWHFTNKQSLLAAVSERILAPVTAGGWESGSLRDAVIEAGTQLHECLLAWRDGSELVSSSLALGLIDAPLHEPLIATARRLGAPEALARTAAEAVTHFVIGHAFHEQQQRQAARLGALAASRPGAAPEHPETPSTPPSEFSAGLELIAAGVEASVGASPA
ncbi:TetR family transcriptional regulator [Brachybacterium endophyticum]|uniref:TetR family transcriptional regulator n=1 Tax=Brachybacterium endophyticum TaxID=2182385 RepID=UPI001F0BD314|nr:TetR family transcriptional regulator [Brachybacterium endophyticum]